MFRSSFFAMLSKDFRFITSSFLTHLVQPGLVAIIDQHNYRSMGHFVRSVQPTWRSKAAPSSFQDLQDVTYFLNAMTSPPLLSLAGGHPTTRDVDMFLMAHGKSIK